MSSDARIKTALAQVKRDCGHGWLSWAAIELAEFELELTADEVVELKAALGYRHPIK